MGEMNMNEVDCFLSSTIFPPKIPLEEDVKLDRLSIHCPNQLQITKKRTDNSSISLLGFLLLLFEWKGYSCPVNHVWYLEETLHEPSRAIRTWNTWIFEIMNAAGYLSLSVCNNLTHFVVIMPLITPHDIIHCSTLIVSLLSYSIYYLLDIYPSYLIYDQPSLLSLVCHCWIIQASTVTVSQ